MKTDNCTVIKEKMKKNKQADHIEQMFNHALQLQQTGQVEQAIELYQQILSIEPVHHPSLHCLGIVAAQCQDFQLAAAFFSRAIKANPKSPESYNDYANVLKANQQYQDALTHYQQAIKLKPYFAQAYYNQGNTYQVLGQYTAALAAFQQAVAIAPDYADAYVNAGNMHLLLKQYQQATNSYECALALKPDFAEVYYNLGNVLHATKQYQAALDNYQKAIHLKPDFQPSYVNCAQSLLALKRYPAALECSLSLLKQNHEQVQALNNSGLALYGLKRYQEALDYYEQAIRLKPDYAEAYHNHAMILNDLKQYDAAKAEFEYAIKLKPDAVDAYFNLALLHYEQNHFAIALNLYDTVYSLQSDYPFLLGYRLHTKMHICDWRNFEQELAELASLLENQQSVSAPFPVVTLLDNAQLQQQTAKLWTQTYHPANLALTDIPAYQHNKIRIAYLSADFHEHATAYLMAGVFAAHDKEKFEITAVSFGPDLQDAMRTRLQTYFDHFFDVRELSDEKIATLLREWEIDIAIDLKGHTHNSRLDIFAQRAAPIQISYLGYPGTIGADYIDYILADNWVLPTEQQGFYDEKVLYLPNSYQANDDQRAIADYQPSRAELNLPETGLVFCCFNHTYKITPEVFTIWLNLLEQVPGSVLWLLASNPQAVKNLSYVAEQCGISAQRLIFAENVAVAKHLARQQQADIFLDTFPCNAHTTASDALWAGLPVLTCSGKSFVSRVAGSLLRAIDLPELITDNLTDYQNLALKLANDRGLLADIRAKLAKNRTHSALFDSVRFCRGLEAVLTEVWQKGRV